MSYEDEYYDNIINDEYQAFVSQRNTENKCKRFMKDLCKQFDTHLPTVVIDGKYSVCRTCGQHIEYNLGFWHRRKFDIVEVK